jgi:hypothetical protein
VTEPEEITIEIPDFARMTDEEVAAHPLCGLIDGRWSRLTKMLMEVWETDKFDLNDPWAWTCNGFVPVTYLIMPPWLRTRAG